MTAATMDWQCIPPLSIGESLNSALNQMFFCSAQPAGAGLLPSKGYLVHQAFDGDATGACDLLVCDVQAAALTARRLALENAPSSSQVAGVLREFGNAVCSQILGSCRPSSSWTTVPPICTRFSGIAGGTQPRLGTWHSFTLENCPIAIRFRALT